MLVGLVSGQSTDVLSQHIKPDYKRDFLQLDSIISPRSLMFQKFDYSKNYHNSLGFFCKVENKASKHAPVQLRMRLGSLEYVDRLEQKNTPPLPD